MSTPADPPRQDRAPTTGLPSKAFDANPPLTDPAGVAAATADGGSAFQDHILSILSRLSAIPSPSSPPSTFPSPSSVPVPVVPAFKGPGASFKTEAILGELQLLALRLHDTEQREREATAKLNAALAGLPDGTPINVPTPVGPSKPAGSLLLTPEPTPPILPGDSARQQQALANRLKSAPAYSLGSTSSGPFDKGGNINSGIYESGLGPTEELRLLRAQVQDIARVCKVRRSASPTVAKVEADHLSRRFHPPVILAFRL